MVQREVILTTHVSVQAKQITLRIELPPVNGPDGPPSLVILHLDSLIYSGLSTELFTYHKIPSCLSLKVSAQGYSLAHAVYI